MKVYLQVKPAAPKTWWPKENDGWATIDCDGGWHVEPSKSMAFDFGADTSLLGETMVEWLADAQGAAHSFRLAQVKAQSPAKGSKKGGKASAKGKAKKGARSGR
jgi:hypothetical protein